MDETRDSFAEITADFEPDIPHLAAEAIAWVVNRWQIVGGGVPVPDGTEAFEVDGDAVRADRQRL